MRVEAIRDDGALLITDGEAALILDLDGAGWVTTRGAALSRGAWEPHSGDIPDAVQREWQPRLDEQKRRLPHLPMST